MSKQTNAPTGAFKEAQEPILRIEVSWGDPDVPKAIGLYSDKASGEYEARILSFSGLQNQIDSKGTGTISSVNISLDDHDGVLKALINTHALRMQGSKVVVSVYFDNDDSSMELFRGNVNNPIWDEGQRTLSFGVITKLASSREIGYAIPKTAEGGKYDKGVGKPWPFVYGTAAHVPAVLIRQTPETVLIDPIQLVPKGDLAEALFKVVEEEDKYDHITAETELFLERVTGLDINNFPIAEADTIAVEDTSLFPQEGPFKVDIDGVIFTVSVVGAAEGTLTVIESNIPRYENVVLKARPVGDKDEDNPKVCWLEDTSIDLANHFVMDTYEQGKEKIYWENVCVRQEGVKCWFKKPFLKAQVVGAKTHPSTVVWGLLGAAAKLQFVRTVTRHGLKIETDDFITETSKQSNQRYRRGSVGTGRSDKKTTTGIERQLALLAYLKNSFWSVNAGAEVIQWEAPSSDRDVYVANIYQSIEIKSVYAVKAENDEKSPNAEDIFVPIPTSYYTKNLADASITHRPIGSAPTTITLNQPLKTYRNQGWQADTIYVTVDSTAKSNLSVILAHLLNNYTALTPDTSFDIVKNQVENFPCNFYLTEITDALELAKDIAWQGRCALIIEGESVKLKYLSLEPSSFDFEITEASTILQSMEVSFTDWEDHLKNLVGRWRVSGNVHDYPDAEYQYYSDFDSDKIGKDIEEREIFIYNNLDLVERTIDFWGRRSTQSWRTIKVKTPLSAIHLESYDTIKVTYANNLAGIVSGTAAILIESKIDIHKKECELTLLTPVSARTFTVDPNFWQNDAGFEKPDNPADTLSEKDASYIKFEAKSDLDEVVREWHKMQEFGRVLGKVTNIHNINLTEFTVALYPDGPFEPSSGTMEALDINAPFDLRVGSFVYVLERGQDGINFVEPSRNSYSAKVKANLRSDEGRNTTGYFYRVQLMDFTGNGYADQNEFNQDLHDTNPKKWDSIYKLIYAYNSSETHLDTEDRGWLPDGSVVELTHYATGVGDGFWQFNYSYSPADKYLFIVYVKKDGGLAGDAENMCSWTYLVKDLKGNQLGKTMPPETQRPTIGAMLFGHGNVGIGWYDLKNVFHLLSAGEVPDPVAC